jgi:hypothetical protein
MAPAVRALKDVGRLTNLHAEDTLIGQLSPFKVPSGPNTSSFKRRRPSAVLYVPT